ncbi:extracellular solute-binding protein [Treponema sp. OMZ 840]|uniref:extracellular solute-binding protein n=1 Tax=Treponema sp. OMZ 840 TaxID=244313 RepID=UPI003D91C65E
MKKMMAVLSVVLMIVFLGGCKKQSGTAKGGSKAAGVLNVYTTVSDLQYNAIMGAFQNKYPDIKINYTQAGAGECKTRIQAEAGNPQADVMFGGLVYADTLTYGSYFENYVCANDKLMPNEFKNTTGVLTYHDTQIPCLWVNDALEKEKGIVIKGYTDLLDPRLKGIIASADPTGSSSAWNQLQCILTDFGGWDNDKAWEYVDRLLNNLVITSGSSAVYKGVYNGEYAVGLTYEPACVQMLSEGAQGVHIVYPSEGVTSIAFGSAIIKGCANMDNAKLFMDFLQSDECQAIYLESGARPATASKLSVKNEYIVDLSAINYLEADTMALANNQKAIFSRWNNLRIKH